MEQTIRLLRRQGYSPSKLQWLNRGIYRLHPSGQASGIVSRILLTAFQHMSRVFRQISVKSAEYPV